MFEFLKIIVQPVLLERDENGKVIREHMGEPTALYTLDDISKYVEAVNVQIAVENSKLANTDETANDKSNTKPAHRHSKTDPSFKP